MKLFKALIGDGCEMDATHSSGVMIRYRPALPKKGFEYQNALDQYEASIKLLLEHIVGWNISQALIGFTTPDAAAQHQIALLNDDNIRHLSYPLVTWAVNTILGYGLAQAADDAKN
jgi:hypothetical protein